MDRQTFKTLRIQMQTYAVISRKITTCGGKHDLASCGTSEGKQTLTATYKTQIAKLNM